MKGTLTTLLLTGMMAGISFAQVPEVGQRKINQQDRIANGVKNGSLSAGETHRLERKEGAINRETRRDRARNGGPLTAHQKARVNRQQNHVSRSIYHDKHNAIHQ